MTDPLDKLADWREMLAATSEDLELDMNGDGDATIWADVEADDPFGQAVADGAFITTAHDEMVPALLTAVENVLNLHSPWPSDSENPHRCAGCDADWPHCDTVIAIRDAIGGAA